MNGTDETEPSLEKKFTIANIFQSIQQKLKRTKSEESGNSVFSANSSRVSKQCGGVVSSVSEQTNKTNTTVTPSSVVESSNQRSCSEISLASTPVSEPSKNDIVAGTSDLPSDHEIGSVVTSAPALDRCGDSSVFSAPAPEVCSEDAVGGQHGWSDHDPLLDFEGDTDCSEQSQRHGDTEKEDHEVHSESSGKDTSELQTKSPGGIPEQAIAENETGQRQHDETDRCVASSVLSQSVPGNQTQSDHIVIKQEKKDAGYELYSHNSNGRNEAEMYTELVKVKEPFESGDYTGLGNDGDVVFHGVSYRDPDDGDDKSDSDTSSLSSYGVQAEEPEHENAQVAPRSKGEVLPEELPPLENLHISLPEETRLEMLGVVSGIVGVLVVIESTVDLKCYSPLNDDSVLFYENRQPFGVVFEVFGPCKAPYYSVRFNSADDIKEKGIGIGLKVYFVPDPVPEVGEITHFVFVQKLKKIKGSDASWKGNNEPPEELVDYSDDEEEKRIKTKRKAERAQERAQRRATDPSKSVTNEEKNGGKGPPSKKKHTASAHGGAPSESTHARPDSGGRNRYHQDSQQSSSVGQGREQSTSRRDFCLSEPVLARPSNPVTNFPRQPNPWGPRSSLTFLPRSRAPENLWARGPFSGSSRNGPYSGGPDQPAGAGGRDPSSDKPKSGSFVGGTDRPPFLDSPNIWRPYQAYCTFPVNTSAPPPNFSTLSDGQGNSQQGHPPPPPPLPPPPPQWTSSCQPPPSSGSQPFSFSHNLGRFGPPLPSFSTGPSQPGFSTGPPGPGFGTGPPHPDIGTGPSQPGFGFGSPGSGFGTGPQQWHFGAVSQPPPKFQGQPQFVRYHQGQN